MSIPPAPSLLDATSLLQMIETIMDEDGVCNGIKVLVPHPETAEHIADN
jgi:hypothetical protein